MDGAIHRRRGPEILAECRELRRTTFPDGLPTGQAVATTAGRLPATWVIHGAVMGQDLRTSAELIERTTASVLEVADELGAESLALPAFGTGVGGFPLEDCARVMVRTVRDHEPRNLEHVVFAVYGEQARAAFERALV